MTQRPHLPPIAGLLACLASAAWAEDAPARPPAWTPPPPAEGERYPDCYCTNRGARVEIGALACLSVGGGVFTARCVMSLNNPAWRREREGCETAPSAALPGSGPLPGPIARLIRGPAPDHSAFGRSIRASQAATRLAFTPRSEWP